ncbi:uncharacterized protein MKZ38_007955 [Zalerion maritima]|uniref:Uncharacterized protein n=1 Tax=Zalerion maritima TaxID=339359 RepID=A0AAD5RHH4_9PEZI|nr:uncharacterized protein MKZ38_007955 [Zalerion maritima]
MTISAAPDVVLDHLSKADGSASYSYAGYAVTATVNGPIEAQRRDEQPFEAIVDVIVRPAAGVGGTRERHLESILCSTLRHLILLKNFPRQLFQIALQITSVPENDYVNSKLMQASSSQNLSVLPTLFQTAILALVSAAVPMKTTASATTIAIPKDYGSPLLNPTPRQVQTSSSIHVFAFTRQGDLLLSQSDGSFSQDEWDVAHDIAKDVCMEKKREEVDVMLDDDESQTQNMADLIRAEAQMKTDSDLHWK